MTTKDTRMSPKPEIRPLRVAVLQASSHGMVAENLRAIRRAAIEARTEGADLLVTPELFSTGYHPAVVHTRDGAADRDQIASIAADTGIAIVASTVEHDHDRHYISASFLDDLGRERSRYRKINLFGPDEANGFEPGRTAPSVFDFHGVAVSLGICFDVEFPEFVRAAAIAGAELLCVPTAVPLRSADHPFDTRLVPTMVVPTRALESQVYIAYANHAGERFAGRSSISDPYGRLVAGVKGQEASLFVGEVAGSIVAQARRDTDYLRRVAKPV